MDLNGKASGPIKRCLFIGYIIILFIVCEVSIHFSTVHKFRVFKARDCISNRGYKYAICMQSSSCNCTKSMGARAGFTKPVFLSSAVPNRLNNNCKSMLKACHTVIYKLNFANMF